VKPFCRLLVSPGLLLALFLAAVPLFAGEVVDRILIYVNSRIISQGLFEARLDQVSRENGPPPDAARREDMKKSVLEELVNEALLEDRAKELDLITSDQEIEDQIKKLKEQNNVTSDEDFVRALAANGLTVDRLRDQLRKSLTVQRVVGREVNSKVDLSDDALRATYEREKDTWKVPEKARLAEILIAKGDDAASRQRAERRAKEASDLVKAGTKFEAVVAQYSDGATKSRGGDLGIVARGELNPEIDRAVFSLPVGGVTDPVSSKFGWHIVKLIERMPATYKPFSEVKADLLKREQETQFQKKLAEYLQKLRQEAVIKVAPEALPYYTPPALLSLRP
jgi:parvulin-like peptidyl-prolyl isomerase